MTPIKEDFSRLSHGDVIIALVPVACCMNEGDQSRGRDMSWCLGEFCSPHHKQICLRYKCNILPLFLEDLEHLNMEEQNQLEVRILRT
jgi:hypothetical protein